MKTGRMACTDSFTPRMLRIVSRTIAATSMTSFVRCTGSEPGADRPSGASRSGVRAEPVARDHAEDRVAARRDRHRDREHVVDEERAAADDAEARSEELGRDDVAAAAGREVLDDARVRVRDDEDGERGPGGEADGEGRVVAAVGDELAKRGLRAVRRRREAVGAEADPREHRDERDAVERVLGVHVLGRAEEQRADLVPHQ